jgi:TatD-related deoxyribonuclease
MIFDNHMHLDERGLFLDAVSMFEKAGGTHLILVHKPMYSKNLESLKRDFGKTISMSSLINERSGIVSYPVVGMHPAEFDVLCKESGIQKAEEIFFEVFQYAETLFEERLIVGIGEVGWPHYPTEAEVMESSKRMLSQAFSESKRKSIPLQLHTESLDENGFLELKGMMERNGDPKKIVKHFCPPSVMLCERLGIYPSIIASEKQIEVALEQGRRFFMETDFIDEPERPGAVLGPKSVPKTTKRLLEKGIMKEEDAAFIHTQLPEEVYNIRE